MIMNFIAIVLAAVLLIGFVLVVVGTLRKNRWGVNTAQLTCPNCGGRLLNRVRAPKTISQALWGGSTCNGCGLDLDKWGRPVNRPRAQTL